MACYRVPFDIVNFQTSSTTLVTALQIDVSTIPGAVTGTDAVLVFEIFDVASEIDGVPSNCHHYVTHKLFTTTSGGNWTDLGEDDAVAISAGAGGDGSPDVAHDSSNTFNIQLRSNGAINADHFAVVHVTSYVHN